MTLFRLFSSPQITYCKFLHHIMFLALYHTAEFHIASMRTMQNYDGLAHGPVTSRVKKLQPLTMYFNISLRHYVYCQIGC